MQINNLHSSVVSSFHKELHPHSHQELPLLFVQLFFVNTEIPFFLLLQWYYEDMSTQCQLNFKSISVILTRL